MIGHALMLVLIAEAEPASVSPSTSPQANQLQGAEYVGAPTVEDMSRVFPVRALEDGVSGRAVIRCVVDGDGYLGSCAVVEEDPAGYGFGAALMNLSPRFRLAPFTREGQTTAGGTIDVRVRFNVPN